MLTQPVCVPTCLAPRSLLVTAESNLAITSETLDARDQRQALRRHRAFATALLVAMGLVYLAVTWSGQTGFWIGLVAAGADAQFRGRFAPRLATPDDYDGSFHFCRGWFRSGFGGDGGGWAADYPWADINLSIRLGEMTKTTVSKDAIGDPKPLMAKLKEASDKSAHESIEAFFDFFSGEMAPRRHLVPASDLKFETFSIDLPERDARMLRALAEIEEHDLVRSGKRPLAVSRTG